MYFITLMSLTKLIYDKAPLKVDLELKNSVTIIGIYTNPLNAKWNFKQAKVDWSLHLLV